MNTINYSYNASSNPFRRKHYLYKNKDIYAKLTFNLFGFAKYENKHSKAFIKSNKVFFPKSFNIIEFTERQYLLAIYSFKSLKHLPEGSITCKSGKEYRVINYKKYCYHVFINGVIFAEFKTIPSKGFFKLPSLSISIKKGEDHEVILFSMWYMMITIGMGLREG